MKCLFLISVIISIVLILVAGDRPQNNEYPETTLAPPVNESALPCDVKLMIYANRITELNKKLEENKAQKKAMKVIMKQVLNLIIANIYRDDDDEKSHRPRDHDDTEIKPLK